MGGGSRVGMWMGGGGRRVGCAYGGGLCIWGWGGAGQQG